MFPRCQTLAGDWRPARQIPLSSSTGCCDAVNFGVDTTDRDRNTVETQLGASPSAIRQCHSAIHLSSPLRNIALPYITLEWLCSVYLCPILQRKSLVSVLMSWQPDTLSPEQMIEDRGCCVWELSWLRQTFIEIWTRGVVEPRPSLKWIWWNFCGSERSKNQYID